MKINNRLKQIGEMINSKDIILDVGCDHALLDVYCIKERKCKKAYASDNKKGPLEKAKENISFYKLSNKIKTILSDGIEVVEKDVNTIVISGMGGLSIIDILNSNFNNLENIDTLILSPNNEYYRVRKNLNELGFYIESELVVKEKNIFYIIIKCKKGKKNYSHKQLSYGPILLTKTDQITKEYFKDEKNKKNIIYSLTPSKYIIRRHKLKREINYLNKIINK